MTLEIGVAATPPLREGGGADAGMQGQRQPAPAVAAVNPSREYVTAGVRSWGWRDSYLRTLPSPVERLLPELTADIYDRMLLDPQIEACIGVLKHAVLAQGVTLAPAVPDSGTPEAPDTEYTQAVEVADFCTRAFERLQTPINAVLEEMLDALVYGYTVAEQVYEPVNEGPDAGTISLKAIKVKENTTVAFRVDPYLNVVAIRNLTSANTGTDMAGANVGTSTRTGTQDADPADLPREKFAVLSFRPRRGDPRGRSLLRAVYEWWYRKQGTLVEYDKYLAQFAGPSVIGFTPDKAQPVPQYDANGLPVMDVSGLPVTKAPEEVMAASLMAWRNGIAAAFPFGSRVEVHAPQGEGDPFIKLLDLADRQIVLAILKQTLATLEGQHQARAASETHQDVMGLVVLWLKRWVAAMIRSDILVPLVRYNFGEACLCMVPTVSLGETDEQDFAGDSNAMAGLGYRLDPSQYAEIDAMLGLPVRTENEPDSDLAAAEDAAGDMNMDAGNAIDDPAPAGTGAGARRGAITDEADRVTGTSQQRTPQRRSRGHRGGNSRAGR